MHRFFCSSLTVNDQQFRIDDTAEFQHMTRVLRLKMGDEVELINGKGALARARLLKVSRHSVDMEVVQYYQSPCPDAPRIILACAMPKRSGFDAILEKCTELGVNEVIPLITERTEVSPSSSAIVRMSSRFNSVIISASKQCKRLWFPVMHPLMRFEQAVDQCVKETGLLLLPWLEGQRAALKDVIHGSANKDSQRIIFFIGPEGDFSSAEAQYAINKGAVPVSLGETVLRVETAAIAVVAFTRMMIK